MYNNQIINKLSLTTVLLIISLSTYCQLSINEMISVYKMNLDQFENFSLKKGYSFHRIETDGNKNITAVSYRMGSGYNTKYIRLYTAISNLGLNVDTQTSDEKDILRIKNGLAEHGFSLINSREFEGKYFREYSKDKWLLQIFTRNGDYEISLSKISN